MAFLLMAEIEGWSEAWLCLEAHGDVLSRQLERFIRLVWFPEVQQPGHFSPSTRRLKKRIEEIRDRRKDPRLDDILQKKDRFRLTVTRGPSKAVVNLTVVGYSRTAVMDLSIDLAAFPSGTDLGRKPARELCPGLWGDGSDGTGEGKSVPTHGWSCDSQEGMRTPSSMGCQTPRRMRNSKSTSDRWIGSRRSIARPAWIA